MTTLVTTIYKSEDHARNLEMIQCLNHNVNNKLIDHIYLFVDSVDALNMIGSHHKVIKVFCNDRPSYEDLFEVSSDDSITIVCNGDIYFKEEDVRIIEASLHKDQVYALSRWDETPQGLFHHCTPDSQDAWIFKGKIRKGEFDIPLGKPGCDNRIAYELESAGYEVLNPSKTIRSYHVHTSQSKTYVRTKEHIVPEPYKMVHPQFLNENRYSTPTIKSSVKEKSLVVNSEGDILYNEKAQRETMNEMLLSGNYKKDFLLTIAIPTMKSRRDMFDRLMAELNKQIRENDLVPYVQIYPMRDNGSAPIGYKRNHMNIWCSGEYVAHFDDDDWPSADYVKSLYNVIKENKGVDCVTFNAEVTYDGENPELMIYSLDYKENNQVKLPDGSTYRERMVSHLCAIRREILLSHPFKLIGLDPTTGQFRPTRKERGDSGSDVEFSKSLVASSAITSEVHIDKVLYYYRYVQNK